VSLLQAASTVDVESVCHYCRLQSTVDVESVCHCCRLQSTVDVESVSLLQAAKYCRC
jgi:hypothetical protein